MNAIDSSQTADNGNSNMTWKQNNKIHSSLHNKNRNGTANIIVHPVDVDDAQPNRIEKLSPAAPYLTSSLGLLLLLSFFKYAFSVSWNNELKLSKVTKICDPFCAICGCFTVKACKCFTGVAANSVFPTMCASPDLNGANSPIWVNSECSISIVSSLTAFTLRNEMNRNQKTVGLKHLNKSIIELLMGISGPAYLHSREHTGCLIPFLFAFLIFQH